ncbi:LOG family protein [Bacillus massilinigeriensis]|uniref:LOG family protein n=1 Tax=Bacillus massilionigeriensis TaxID=1805475 RepID=UPI00096AE481|nr:TIGR00730 family Rossman fold protein [Bacillus massilionigeriensis]
MKSVAVFCGSSPGNNPIYMKEARRLGEILAAEGITLVYGGSTVGCMGAVADGVLENGGCVIGVIPKSLQDVEIAHHHLTELHIVKDMHERKAMMAEHADAFIALPGGAGTMEEWFEVYTWAQLGYHEKPCALLSINHYYEPLYSLFDHMINQGFLRKEYKDDLILIEKDPAILIERIKNYKMNFQPKWNERRKK